MRWPGPIARFVRPIAELSALVALAIFLACLPKWALAQPPASAGEESTAASPEQSPEQTDELPPPLTEYYGRTIAPTMSYHGAPWLTRATREREEHGEEMLDALEIAAGQSVADFGCGNGYHTLKLAERVGPTGRVWAVDIQQEMLHLLANRAEQTGVEHLEMVLCSPIDPKLPPGELDLILLVDVYHELSYPEQVLAGLRRALKPEGRLVLVEFRGEDPLVPIKPEHKMTRAQVLKELVPNGFRLAGQYDKLPWQHVLWFQPAEPTGQP